MEVFRGHARRAPHRSFWLRSSLLGSAFLSSFGLTMAEPSLAQDTSSSPPAPTATTSAHPTKPKHHATAPTHSTAAQNTAAPAQGAAASAQVADVVVVARDRAEKAQNVPLPISVVGGKTADREHEERLQDFSEKVPNFTVFAENPRVSSLQIRGVGGDASNDGSESAVGVIVDGVFLTHVGFVWLDLVDLQDVEIVRGPQGTLLGKNTTVGAVIINTQLPSFVRQTSFETTVGNYGHVQTKINTTGPINDQFAYRVTFYGDRTNGYAENLYNGQGLLNSNRFGVRGQLLWTPTAQFSDRLILEHYGAQERNNFNPPLADPTTYLQSGLPRAGWTSHLAGLGYTPTYNIWGNGDLDTLGPEQQRTEGISNTINWQTFANHTLTAITAWRQFHFVPDNDSDDTPLPIFGSGYDVDVNQYSQEIRLASPTNQRLEYTLGFYSLREQVWSTDITNFYSDASAFFLSPALPSLVLNNAQYEAAGTAFTTSLAGFGQATYHVTDRFDITGGFRDTQEWKQGSDTYGIYGGTPLTGPLAPYAIYRASLVSGLGGTGSVSGEEATNSIGWLFNPSYKVNEHILTYFSVAQGEKSGAINTGAHEATSSTTAIPLFVAPERSTDFELGTKTNWFDNRVIFNANLYWNDIIDYQGLAVTNGTTNSGSSIVSAYLTNIPHVRLRGVELEGRASPADGLWLTYNGAFNDARYVSYPNAPPPVELAYNATSNPTGVTSVDLSGKQVIGAPAWTAQGGVYYERSLGPAFRAIGYNRGIIGFVWANESWRSTVSLNNPYSAYGWQHGFALTNLGIGFHTDDDIFSAQLWARNLLDYRYLIAVAPASTYTPYAAYLGDPRTFGLTLKTVF